MRNIKILNTNIDNKELEIFDNNFPHKEKLKLEGQLE